MSALYDTLRREAGLSEAEAVVLSLEVRDTKDKARLMRVLTLMLDHLKDDDGTRPATA